MAQHTFIKSEKYVNLGIAALEFQAVLPNLFRRISGDTFKHAKDDTVQWTTQRVTTARDYEWRTRTAPIILDKIGQTKVDIKLDTHLVQGVPITNEERTMDIRNLATEVVAPQVGAIVTRAEGKVLIGLRRADFKNPLPTLYADSDPYDWALDVRKVLNRQGTPKAGRMVLVGAGAEHRLLRSDRITPPGATPENNVAVREAKLGRIAGLDIVQLDSLEDDEIIAVTPDALVVANVAPEQPDGAIDSANRTYNNWGLLHTYDYDQSYQQNASVLSTFLGVNSVNDELEVVRNAQTKLPELKLDEEGNPIATGKNVRGARGVYVDTAAPAA